MYKTTFEAGSGSESGCSMVKYNNLATINDLLFDKKRCHCLFVFCKF